MNRLTWTIEDLGAFAACNGQTFVPPLLLEHLVSQASEANQPRRRRFWKILLARLGSKT